MKKLILLFLTMAGLSAHASLLEVNSSDKTVYFHPTPLLEVSLTDLGSDGGYLTVFVNYDDAAIKSEMQDLQRQYPTNTIQAIMAEPQQGSVVFSIDQTDVHISTSIRQGQIGPYVNLQTVIPKEQMKQVLAIKSQLSDSIHFSIPVRSNFTETALVEQYSAPTQICSELLAKSVRDLILSVSRLQKPAAIRYPQTFEALKADMIDHCFEISQQQSVSSIKDLLKMNLQISTTTTKLTGEYYDKKSVSKAFDLGTKLKLNWN